jgi:hypothetical protein
VAIKIRPSESNVRVWFDDRRDVSERRIRDDVGVFAIDKDKEYAVHCGSSSHSPWGSSIRAEENIKKLQKISIFLLC